MNKYQNGKIYIITGSESDKLYLGSTINTLRRRLTNHKSNNNCSCKEILNNNEYNIYLLETYTCNSKKELLWRERLWFDELRPILINIRPPIRSKEEYQEIKNIWKENNKGYHHKYRNYCRKQSKDYYNKNKVMVAKKQRWRESWGGDYRTNNNLLKINLDVLK